MYRHFIYRNALDALVPEFSIQFYIIYKVHRCAYQLDRF